ncbi:DUF3551 domain-containing protein [Bradyrhizobium oligotrophicum]|uniref:DUF3551 domain-containing protein n=1 Tax=Bradyrhizobium oligotrophicum TaxID=44255 RepID=UPI003EB756B0
MRKVMMAAGLAGVAFVSVAGAAPAAAGYDYPWCVQGRGVGFPGDCSYQTFEQCRASASGRSASCGINPRVAFGQARRPSVYVDMPPPRRVHRYSYY